MPLVLTLETCCTVWRPWLPIQHQLPSFHWDIATYDFSVGIDPDEIFDISASGLNGVLINAATRACLPIFDLAHTLLKSKALIRPRAKIASVFSTFTYLAYAYMHIHDETKSTYISLPEGVQLSGDELSRMDVAIESPEITILLLRSERHDDHFMLFNEELIFPMIGTLGSPPSLARSDMVYYQTNGGESVFSVGSINWSNSLTWDG
ncbi:unnamed protein product [Clonostachys solani]|uniref:N,N-dimethylformamidase beta subunit-like C-terminal domain-containing protein n=1 Tax=Clonostachys solani TaxID=160281 RepID=A0A9N9W357_9HYPO|nr:unnamed protein product [Clonostachys solani]